MVAHWLAVSTGCVHVPTIIMHVHRPTVVIKSKDSTSWERKQNLILHCNVPAQWWCGGRLTRTNAMHMHGGLRTLITAFISAFDQNKSDDTCEFLLILGNWTVSHVEIRCHAQPHKKNPFGPSRMVDMHTWVELQQLNQHVWGVYTCDRKGVLPRSSRSLLLQHQSLERSLLNWWISHQQPSDLERSRADPAWRQ